MHLGVGVLQRKNISFSMVRSEASIVGRTGSEEGIDGKSVGSESELKHARMHGRKNSTMSVASMSSSSTNSGRRKKETQMYDAIILSYSGDKNSNGEFDSKNATSEMALGHSYSGAFRKHEMHGQGQYTWPDGVSYAGKFSKSRIEGEGCYTYPDNSCYKGTVKNGLRSGQGTFTCSQGTYTGEWKDGMRHGQGKQIYVTPLINVTSSPASAPSSPSSPVECCYEGQWHFNQKAGFGTFVYPSGNVYEGEWQNDLKHGEGSIYWKRSNSRAAGYFMDGLLQGEGEQIWFGIDGVLPNHSLRKNRYVGNFINGVRSGYGTFYYADGGEYTGEWLNSQKHGCGKMTFADGTEYNGNWVEDKPVTEGQSMGSKKSGNSLETSLLTIFDLISPAAALPWNGEAEFRSKSITLLRRHHPTLLAVYRHFASLQRGPDDVEYTLSLFSYWRLLGRMRLSPMLCDIPFYSLAAINRIISKVSMSEEPFSPHNGGILFLYREFQESLIRLAVGLIVSGQFATLEESFDALANACSFALNSPDSSFFSALNHPEILQFLGSYNDALDVLFVEWAKNATAHGGEDITMLVREFAVMCASLKLLLPSQGVTVKRILRCFSGTKECGMDSFAAEGELTFIEFLEGLFSVACLRKPLPPSAEVAAEAAEAQTHLTKEALEAEEEEGNGQRNDEVEGTAPVTANGDESEKQTTEGEEKGEAEVQPAEKEEANLPENAALAPENVQVDGNRVAEETGAEQLSDDAKDTGNDDDALVFLSFLREIVERRA